MYKYYSNINNRYLELDISNIFMIFFRFMTFSDNSKSTRLYNILILSLNFRLQFLTIYIFVSFYIIYLFVLNIEMCDVTSLFRKNLVRFLAEKLKVIF